jgi:hypothetical protein
MREPRLADCTIPKVVRLSEMSLHMVGRTVVAIKVMHPEKINYSEAG